MPARAVHLSALAPFLRLSAVFLLVALAGLPTPSSAQASTFEFSGFTWMDKGAYVRTWAGATDNASGSLTDPASSAWAAFWDFTIAGLAGPAYEAGHNYDVNKTVTGLEVYSSRPADLYYVSGVKTVFSSSLNITSISLDQTATTLTLTGRLVNISVDKTFGSSILNDLAKTGAYFSLVVSTPQSMLAQLNKSSGVRLDAGYSAGLTNELRAAVAQTTATPEPGTLLTLGSALAGLAWWRRRKDHGAAPAQETAPLAGWGSPPGPPR